MSRTYSVDGDCQSILTGTLVNVNTEGENLRGDLAVADGGDRQSENIPGSVCRGR